jgi:hypothetical protein
MEKKGKTMVGQGRMVEKFLEAGYFPINFAKGIIIGGGDQRGKLKPN